MTEPIDAVRRLFQVDTGANLAPRYNIAPSQEVPVVRRRAGGDGAARELAMLRWGLIPFWARDERIGYKLINARAETVAEKPSFRAAFRARRCLVVADGFYEWRKLPEGGKQPYRITPSGGGLMAFAGLWERWDKGDAPVESCTIVTTTAAPGIAHIHGRMPVILPVEAHQSWLVEGGTDLLLPYAGPLQADAVSTHVNRPANDDPACIAPLSGQSTGP